MRKSPSELWTTRNSASGRFDNLKRSGAVFKGVRIENKNYPIREFLERLVDAISEFIEGLRRNDA